MPTKNDRIADELLLSNKVWGIQRTAPLSPRQVQLLTGLSIDQLKERSVVAYDRRSHLCRFRRKMANPVWRCGTTSHLFPARERKPPPVTFNEPPNFRYELTRIHPNESGARHYEFGNCFE